MNANPFKEKALSVAPSRWNIAIGRGVIFVAIASVPFLSPSWAQTVSQERVAAASQVIFGNEVLIAPNYSPALQVPASAALPIKVGRSELLRTNHMVKTAIVGNPLIAEVSIMNENTVILTGVAVGLTNLIILDSDTNEMVNTTVQVLPVTPLGQAPLRTEVRMLKGVTESRFLCGIGSSLCTKALSPAEVANVGPCMNPDDAALDGSRCGDRAASVQPGEGN